MIRLLKAFVDWLDRRFPAKVMINEETWNAVDRRLKFLEMASKNKSAMIEEIFTHHGKRLDDLENNLSAIKKQKEEAKPVSNPKRTFIETGDISLIK